MVDASDGSGLTATVDGKGEAEETRGIGSSDGWLGRLSHRGGSSDLTSCWSSIGGGAMSSRSLSFLLPPWMPRGVSERGRQ